MKKIDLLHTTEGNERILVGLSWDAKQEKVKLLDRFTKKDSQHDLDICCYIYDKNGALLDFVGAEAQDSMDSSGKIYHGGDDMTGEGDGDDESINIELANIPKTYHGIVFMVEIRSNHGFDDVDAPSCRLADGKTDQSLLEIEIDQQGGQGRFAYVMSAVKRSSESVTGWHLHDIREFPDTRQIDDWGQYLSQYITDHD